MRIAYVVPGFSAHDADPGIPVLRDVLGRIGQSADVYILALRYPAPERRYKIGGLQVHALGGDECRGLSRLPLLLSAVLALRREHRRRPFDVVHGLWADEPGAVAVAAGRLLAIPSAISLMGGELVARPALGYGGALSRANRLLCRYALRHAGMAMAAARPVAADTLTGGSRSGDRVRRLAWGIDPTVFAPSQQLSLAGSFRVLHVGSLVPVKGVDLLLRAASRAARDVPGLHVHLVGDGPQRAQLLALAEELDIARRVTLHGPVPREQLGDYYRAANVLCVSSWHEMQPVVVLEAALFGLPVIGTAVGLLPDLVAEGIAVSPPGDIDALAKSLVAIAGNDRRSVLGAALRSRVRSQYLAEHTAHQLLALYAELRQSTNGRGLQRRPASVRSRSGQGRVCAGDPYRSATEEVARIVTGPREVLLNGSTQSRVPVTTAVVNDVSDD